MLECEKVGMWELGIGRLELRIGIELIRIELTMFFLIVNKTHTQTQHTNILNTMLFHIANNCVILCLALITYKNK